MDDVLVLELTEPGRRPEVERCELGPREEVRIVWAPAAAPLRRLLFRKSARYLRGPTERTLLRLAAPEVPKGRFRVLSVHDDVIGAIKVKLPDGRESPVQRDTLLDPVVEQLILQPEDEPPLTVTLRSVDRRAAPSSAFAGSSSGSSLQEEQEELEEPDWNVPGTLESIVNPALNRISTIRERIRQKMRLPPSAVRLAIQLSVLFGLLVFAFGRGRAAREAEQVAEDEAASADASQDAAVDAAQDAAACREELAELHRELVNPDQERLARLNQALDRSLSRASVIAALGEDEVREALDWSEAERPRLVGHIDGVLQEAEWTSSSDRGWVKERLAAAAEAGTEDLAPHVLLWHPRPDERGDQGLETASTGRGTLIGPCGLSERASRFGAGGGLLPIETERRLEVAWSLSTLAAGLTEMRGALTERSYKQHVAAPPEELHLWTVALWHAWNEMPPSGEDGGPSECVRLLVERAAHGRTLAPGEPILPSVVDVLTDGDWTLRTGVSARCPWRAGDLYQGVLLAERTLLEAALSLNEE